MEQRRLRLGDTLDDYCPRERRLTNHAVVAMIDEEIKQTRCTTCDAEHAYKGGKVPKRKKKETPAALYKDVLAGMPDTDASPVLTPHVPPAAVAPAAPIHKMAAPDAGEERALEDLGESAPEESSRTTIAREVEPALADAERLVPEPATDEEKDDLAASSAEDVEEGPVHRPLIRATLPRPEGQKDERRLPEFTIRQAAGRGGNGHFRGGDGRMRPRGANGGGQGGGNRPPGASRFAGSRPAQSGRGPAGRGGPAAGFRGGQQRPGGGSRKRSR
jgi:hypothetical protein